MSADPGEVWVKSPRPALVGDRELDDRRVLCPWVLPLPGGDFRAFYMGHGRASPPRSTGRILSAHSADGASWTKEPGVRIDAIEGAEARALSPCVVALAGGGYRMYFEAHPAPGEDGVARSSILSARSEDGFTFTAEPGARVAVADASVGSPRALLLPEGGVRLYFHLYPERLRGVVTRGNHVMSAASADGVTFTRERGVRIAQTIDSLEREAVYCASTVPLGGGRVRAFYGAWNGKKRARGCIMTALSEDSGLSFGKEAEPCIAPEGPLDGTFASEPCVFRDARGEWQMLYEACDDAGVTRILEATRA